MTITQKLQTPEALFCLKYLLQNGFISGQDIESDLAKFKIRDYKLVPLQDKDFAEELAMKLRELWPAGNKKSYDRKGNLMEYAWRDSVSNLTRRIQTLWDVRELKDYTLEQCLSAARRYLARFEQDTRYMQLLKYFILKQDKVVESGGRIRYVSKSTFADMLEGKDAEDAVQSDWENLLYGNDICEQGELI
ncbi:MAG: hypothetical protein II661_06985 [Bacteroidales bacterium]|nr:hypothetical protein [Bacteroidales bacterium]